MTDHFDNSPEQEWPSSHVGLDTLPYSALLIDERGNIEYANDALAEALGYSKKELQQFSFDHIAPYNVDGCWNDLFYYIQEHRHVELEEKFLSSSGEPIVATASLRLIDYEGGSVILGVMKNFRSPVQKKLASVDDHIKKISGQHLSLVSIPGPNESSSTDQIRYFYEHLSFLKTMLKSHMIHASNNYLIEALHKDIRRLECTLLAYKQLNASKGHNKDHVLIQPYLIEIIQKLEDSLSSGARFDIEIAPIAIHIQKTPFIGLIISELVNNSITHSLNENENKQISILLKEKKNGALRIAIEDNGEGSNYTYDFKGSIRGLGLQIVQHSIDQLGGSMEFQKEEKVNRFLIRLPA